MSTKDFLEAMAAGASGSLVIIAAIAWLLRDKVYNVVLDAIDNKKADIKERIELWFKESIEQRNTNTENLRRNAHSIKGLRVIVLRHEVQFKEWQRMPSVMDRALELLEEGKKSIEDVKKIADEHTTQIAVLLERRKHERSQGDSDA